MSSSAIESVTRPTVPAPIENVYLPKVAVLDRVVDEIHEVKTFCWHFEDPDEQRAFKRFRPGQFAQVSLFGVGEFPTSLPPSPTENETFFTVRQVGSCTSALHQLKPGDKFAVRGPYGNGFPMADIEGRNVLIVGGGFAFTTLRSTIRYMLAPANRKRFGKITAIYGARSPGELLYKDELAAWQASGDIEMIVTVDKGEKGWTGREGFVPTVVGEVKPSSAGAVAIVCGPPVMLRFTIKPLLELGFTPETIITSLERRMSCGIGKCGRCNIGGKYVCRDGPVFTYKQIQELSGGQF
jgi:sulfhydrogenase subunit gamma (sulfur reductase)